MTAVAVVDDEGLPLTTTIEVLLAEQVLLLKAVMLGLQHLTPHDLMLEARLLDL